MHLYHGEHDCRWPGSGDGFGTRDCREGQMENLFSTDHKKSPHDEKLLKFDFPPGEDGKTQI